MKIVTRNPDQKLTRKNRVFRQMVNFELRAAGENENQELYVEGYAATFDSPTVLFECDGIEYKEQIDRQAFTETDMSDVIFNYNHTGKVMARTRNHTLEISVDQKGLYMRARLGGTEEGRQMYNDIQGGYIDRMSFAFTVSESSYDSDKHVRTILKIKKLYDVSAVDIPAYDSTSIAARSFLDLDRESRASGMDTSVPKGATEIKDPKYPIDSNVVPNVGHMPGQKGKTAKVIKAVSGTFYIVDFGDGPHKWYAEGELDAEKPENDDNEDQRKLLILKTYL